MRAASWGFSILDLQSHAVVERGTHPTGVLIAECGHRLMAATELIDRPYGKACEACAAGQFDLAKQQQPAKE